MSAVVQVLLSSHTKPSRGAVGCRQPPVPVSHTSRVHGLSSSQFWGRGVPPQTPPVQVSFSVQVLSSSQELPSSGTLSWVQPLPGLQASVVQSLLSSQLRAPVPTQVPPEHWSV